MIPYKHNIGQKIKTDIPGRSVDMGFIAHFQVSATNAVAASNTGVHAAVALSATPLEITTEITNPAVPRNIRVKGNASGITGDVVITGTNFVDAEITETIALSGSSAIDSNKAFKTVSSILPPAETHAGTDTLSVGWGDKLGLPYKLTHNTVLSTFVDNALESTAATVTVSATAIESNTIDPNTALSGKVVDIYLIV